MTIHTNNNRNLKKKKVCQITSSYMKVNINFSKTDPKNVCVLAKEICMIMQPSPEFMLFGLQEK